MRFFFVFIFILQALNGFAGEIGDINPEHPNLLIRLGISPDDPDLEDETKANDLIRKAFGIAAKKTHSDTSGLPKKESELKFRNINDAYTNLKDGGYRFYIKWSGKKAADQGIPTDQKIENIYKVFEYILADQLEVIRVSHLFDGTDFVTAQNFPQAFLKTLELIAKTHDNDAEMIPHQYKPQLGKVDFAFSRDTRTSYPAFQEFILENLPALLVSTATVDDFLRMIEILGGSKEREFPRLEARGLDIALAAFNSEKFSEIDREKFGPHLLNYWQKYSNLQTDSKVVVASKKYIQEALKNSKSLFAILDGSLRFDSYRDPKATRRYELPGRILRFRWAFLELEPEVFFDFIDQLDHYFKEIPNIPTAEYASHIKFLRHGQPVKPEELAVLYESWRVSLMQQLSLTLVQYLEEVDEEVVKKALQNPKMRPLLQNYFTKAGSATRCGKLYLMVTQILQRRQLPPASL